MIDLRGRIAVVFDVLEESPRIPFHRLKNDEKYPSMVKVRDIRTAIDDI